MVYPACVGYPWHLGPFNLYCSSSFGIRPSRRLSTWYRYLFLFSLPVLGWYLLFPELLYFHYTHSPSFWILRQH